MCSYRLGIGERKKTGEGRRDDEGSMALDPPREVSRFLRCLNKDAKRNIS